MIRSFSSHDLINARLRAEAAAFLDLRRGYQQGQGKPIDFLPIRTADWEDGRLEHRASRLNRAQR